MNPLKNSHTYLAQIDRKNTSITILAGPICFTTNVPTGQGCETYGEDLKEYFISKFLILSTPYVVFIVSAFTTGTFSCAILEKHISPPPTTAICILPSLGKESLTY